jgi:hypothetical protein
MRVFRVAAPVDQARLSPANGPADQVYRLEIALTLRTGIDRLPACRWVRSAYQCGVSNSANGCSGDRRGVADRELRAVRQAQRVIRV